MDRQHAFVEIETLDPEIEALREPKATAVEELDCQGRSA
jgi:hypothetical protein